MPHSASVPPTGVVQVLAWKLRITVLWIFLAVCQTAAVALLMFQPGVIRDMMAGDVLGTDVRDVGVQINTALFWLAPMVMAYLTLVLKDAANRRTNALIGAGAALNTVAVLATDLGETSAGVALVEAVAIIVAVLIVWHAWRWPALTEATPPRPGQESTQREA